MYYLRSSVLGGRVVAELTAQGTRKRSYAYANGEEIARFDGDTQNLLFTMRNPVTGCSAFQQLDPTGAYVGLDDPYLKHQNVDYGTLKGADGFAPDFFVGDGNPFDQGAGCTWNQMPISCGYVAHLLGASVIAPQDQVIPVRYGRDSALARFQAFADGYQGYVAVTEDYVGEGVLRPRSINPRTKGKPRLGGYDGPSNKGNWGGANGATDGDPEVLLARSVGFNSGGGQRREYGPKNDKRLPTPEDVRKIPTPPPWSSCGESVSQDIKSIFGTYRQTVYELTRDQQRLEDGYSGNFCSSLYLGSWGLIGNRYLGCGEQVDKVTSRLLRNKYDDKWSFETQSRTLPFPHQWGRAQSDNPNNRIVIYDPWNDKIYCEKKR